MLRSPGVTKYMFVVVILNAVSSDVSSILKQGETRVFAQFCGGKPLNRRTKVNYLSTMVEGKMDPSHKIAAQQWIDFLRSPSAQAILVAGGFVGATPAELAAPFVYPTP